METSIGLGDLLWRTRGPRWDYTFLLTPKVALEDFWYRAYRLLMSHELIREGEDGLIDEVLSLQVAPGFCVNLSIATVIDGRQDAFGRPIRHTFGLYLPDCGALTQAVPTNWHSTIWAPFNAAYEVLHRNGSLGEGSQNEARKIIQRELARTCNSSQIVGNATTVTYLNVRRIEL